jgi:hypothetical protein
MSDDTSLRLSSAPFQGPRRASAWHYRIRSLPEDDRPDSVVLSSSNELIHNLLHGVDTPHTFAIRTAKIGCLHRLRNIKCQHQVAPGLDLPDRRFNKLWPRKSNREQAQQIGASIF